MVCSVCVIISGFGWISSLFHLTRFHCLGFVIQCADLGSWIHRFSQNYGIYWIYSPFLIILGLNYFLLLIIIILLFYFFKIEIKLV